MTTLLSGTTFSFFTPEELRNVSVCEVVNPKTFDAQNVANPGGLYDPRLGPTERGAVCPTCSETERNCHGHLGRVEHRRPVGARLDEALDLLVAARARRRRRRIARAAARSTQPRLQTILKRKLPPLTTRIAGKHRT